MNRQASLERRYRRLLAFYPRAFRREHEEEMLVVLLACAREGRRRPGAADTMNLAWHATWLRVRPTTRRSVPTVYWGVRAMLLGAALELAAVVALVASRGVVHAALAHAVPRLTRAQWTAIVHGQLVPAEIGALIAGAAWLALAWANDRGRRWARAGIVGMLLVNAISLLGAVGRQAATYAVTDLIAGAAICLVATIAMVLVLSPESNRHYEQRRSGGWWRAPASVPSDAASLN